MKGIPSLRGVEPGHLYTMTGTDVWKVMSMCDLPTIRLRNMETGDELDGAVGSPLLAKLMPLCPSSGYLLPLGEITKEQALDAVNRYYGGRQEEKA